MLVPAYFHPTVAPADWGALTALAGHSVVLNIDSGPGPARSPEFETVATALRAAGVRLLGYVDEAYGTRPAETLLAQAARYREWYGTNGIFLDRAPADPGHLPAHHALATALRTPDRPTAPAAAPDARSAPPPASAGAGGGVVANHGVYPASGYAASADLLVVFEGPYAAHQGVRPPGWARRLPAERFCHLVYGVPAAALPSVRSRAAACNAGVLYATDRAGANPYDGLPGYFAEEIDGHGRLTG